MTTEQLELVRMAMEAALDKKAEDVEALDLHGLSSVADWFLIASGGSDTQVRAIADGIRERLAGRGIEPIGTEGYNAGTWVLVDYADLVVHVFHREKRAYYALDKLWSDAPRITTTGGEDAPTPTDHGKGR
jgi:ribosome-associated protein